MLGVALAFRQGAMLSVEMLHSFLGPRNKRWLEHVILVICVAFLGFMAWAGGQMTWRVRFQTMPSLEFSISRSEEHTSELQSLMRISYAVFCLQKKNHK